MHCGFDRLSDLRYNIIDSFLLHSGYVPPGSQGPTSYENYRIDILKNLPKSNDTAGLIPNEPTLRMMYEAARNDKIASIKSQSDRNISVSLILIAICIILFVTQWIKKDK